MFEAAVSVRFKNPFFDSYDAAKFLWRVSR